MELEEEKEDLLDAGRRTSRGAARGRPCLALVMMAACCLCPLRASAETKTEVVQYESKKEQRLNVAGWTLIGVGIAFPVVATSVSASKNLGKDCDLASCPDVSIWVTSMVLGPAMIVTGTALLLKRRGLRKVGMTNMLGRHRHNAPTRPSSAVARHLIHRHAPMPLPADPG